MQLDGNERAVLAYFPCNRMASRAVHLLNERGFKETSLAKVPATDGIDDPGSYHLINSLSQLGDDTLLEPWEVGYRWLVTVVAPPAEAEQAAGILRACGGNL